MSGRRQHYIPQCVLSAFEAQRVGKHPQVFVYPRRAKPYRASVRDIAVQRNFYSNPAESTQTLDDQITAYENRLSTLLNSLKTDSVDSAIAAEVITHLTVRGAVLRDVFGFAVERMLSAIGSLWDNEEGLRRFLGIDQTALNPLFEEEFETAVRQLQEQVPRDVPIELLRRFALVLMREEFANVYQANGAQTSKLLAGVVEIIPKMVRQGHAKALAQTLAPQERLDELKGFYWRIIDSMADTFVLPDCVALAFSRSAGVIDPYALTTFDAADEVIFAITPHRILIGTRERESHFPLAQYNEAAASCSSRFFVSSRSSLALEGLTSKIGSRSQDNIATLVDEAFREMGGPTPARSDPGGSDYSLRFALNFPEVKPREFVEPVTAAVQSVVSVVGRLYRLDRLETLTFGTSSAVHDKLPFGAIHLVLRDSKVAAQVEFPDQVAVDLVSPERELRDQAIYVLVRALDRVGLIGSFDTNFPGVLLRPTDDPWKTTLLDIVFTALSSYSSARTAAVFLPGITDALREEFLASLNSAFEMIPKERLAYRYHRNLDQFLAIALPRLAVVLSNAANLLGHCHGGEESEIDSREPVRRALEARGLHKWIDVFARDLRTLLARRRDWLHLDDFLFLGMHVERLMWQFGLFPWRTPAGVRVEIPLISDAVHLSAATPRPPEAT